FIFYGPLFFAAFVLSIVAMAQRRVGSGLALLCCGIIPPIAFVYYLGLIAHRLQASDSLKSPSPSPLLETTTPAQAQSKFTSEATPTPSPAELATTSSTPVEVAPQTFPESTFTATPNALDASLATATPAATSTYRVIGVSRGDYLNVREGAGSNYPVIATLEPSTGGIILGTKRAANGETTWHETSIRGRTGGGG